MAFSLHIPPALEVDARARCERLGISLNSLLCVALDAYLRAPSEPAADSRAAPSLSSPEPAAVVPAPVPGRAERRRLERLAQKRR